MPGWDPEETKSLGKIRGVGTKFYTELKNLSQSFSLTNLRQQI